MTKTLGELLAGLISKPKDSELKVIVQSTGYPQRITNGTVKKLIDANVLKSLAHGLYEYKTGSADVMFCEVTTGTLEAFYDSKKGECVLDPKYRTPVKNEAPEKVYGIAIEAYAH